MRRTHLGGSYTVIEWNTGSLRVVTHYRGRVTSHSLPLTLPPEEQAYEVSQHLTALRARRHILGSILVVVPSHQITYRWIPPRSHTETERVPTRLDVAHLLGLPTNEIVAEQKTLPDGTYLTACRKGYLLSYLSAIVKAQLSVKGIVGSAVALWSGLCGGSSEGQALLELRSPVNGLVRATVAAGRGPLPQLIHSFAFDRGEEGRLAPELFRLLAEFQRSTGILPASLTVAGDQVLSDSHLNLLERQLSLKVEWAPEGGWGLSPEDALLAIIGQAVARTPDILSFPVPEPEPSWVAQQTWERVSILSSVAAIIAIALGLFFSWQNRLMDAAVQQMAWDISAKSSLLTRLEKETPKVQIESLQRLADEKNDPRHSPLDLLYWVSKSLPKSVWVQQFSYLRGSQAMFRGTSVSHPGVTDAAHALADLRLPDGTRFFTEVQTNFANTVAVSERTQVEFQITGWLRERTRPAGRQVGLR